MDIIVNKPQLPDEFIQEIATQKGVTKTELDALLLALQGFSGSDIAKKLSITQAAVRKRLGESYKKFQIEGNKNKKIYALKQYLFQDYQASEATKPKISENWSEAVDVEGFKGREKEISELTRWVKHRKCRLIAVLGFGGIGKTMLAAKIVKEVREDFDYIIWRSLSNSPQLNDILAEILQFLPKDNRSDLDSDNENHDKKILHLVDVLRKHRCLIVLDNVESILSSSEGKDHELAGKYEDGYQNYGDLFQKIGEASHKSCLLLTSREKPLQVAMLEGKNLPVKVLQLQGLKLEDASAILKDKGFTNSTCSTPELKQLVDLYSGNPLALKMVATTIYDLFDNKVSEFLEQIDQKTAVYGDIRTLLEEQFNRLSKLETQLMYWFAINRDSVSLAHMKKDLIVQDNIRILEAVESLLWRSLIEKAVDDGVGRFSLQSVVAEFIRKRLVVQAAEEIIRTSDSKIFNDFKIINTYPLIKARSLDYFRQRQERSILEPLNEQLLEFFNHERKLESHLKSILDLLRGQSLAEKGYAAGNIINLMRHLKIDLSGCNFSNLTIRQAYFKDVKLQKTEFTDSDFKNSVFSDTMSSLVSVGFSHDGRYFATGVINGEVRLWQTDEIKLFSILKGHNVWVWAFAFSPDNKIIASGSADYKINLWDIGSGECIDTLRHDSKVYSLAFNTDGRLLASASEDKSVKIWNIKTGKCEKTLNGHTGSVLSVDFHPKQKDIIASSDTKGNIKLWNIRTEDCLKTFYVSDEDSLIKEEDKIINAIHFHPDGELLVSCGADKTVRLWDLATGNYKPPLFGHEGKVYKVRFSPNGKIIASCSEDRTIKLWDTDSRKCKQTLSGHTSQVWDIGFHPSGRTLISGSDDQTARFWNIEDGTCWNILKGYTRGVFSLAFSPDSKTLVSAQDGQIIIHSWKLEDFKYNSHLRGHKGKIRSVAFSSDGRTLASGSADRQIKLWDIQNIHDGKEILSLNEHENWVWTVVFSPDGQTLASGGEDNTIRIWNVKTGDCTRVIMGHSQWVCAISFNPRDSNTIASGSADSTVKLWDVNTGVCIRTLEEHINVVYSVAFSPDGQILATGSEDKTIKLWNPITGECLHTLRQHTQQVYSVAFSPDGKMLASGSGDTTINLWQVETGELLDTLADVQDGHTQPIRCVAFSPDGELLASGGEDEKILIWQMENRQILKQLKTHRFYEGMEITNISGLTEPEKASLRALGAVENTTTSHRLK
ncbi:WD-40 repeat protein [Calothrix parasitica NIES-267]|uniref:WD-40 repeat protein n=1 Tax=Calothrix parasitica NIES-267 TaxID=1973488 RepID=A0A1Z4LZ05_9CYAN|nr:WD-40 repeat protein [Calothrix parasitica NIES-267]